MNASIPGRYGFRRRSEQRQVALERAWAEVHELVEEQSAQLHRAPHLELQWDQFHQALDPAAGDLDPQRAHRKRLQVESLASFALEMMDVGAK
ncbi:Uncharacterized protein SCF082_LOCUS27385, partial [Durusdinium trenchii]